MNKSLILLAISFVKLFAQPSGGSVCNVSNAQTNGYVLTAVGTGRNCSWQAGGGGGSGTVSSGTAGRFGWYSATGTTISGSAALTDDATNINVVSRNLAIGTTLSVLVTALSTPAAPTVTVVGTPGSTSCGYTVQAYNNNGHSIGSTETVLTNCPDILDNTNKINIVAAAVSGASFIEVFRTTAGVSPSTPTSIGPIGSVSGSGGTLVDNGIVTNIDLGFSFDLTPGGGNTSSGLYTASHLTQGDVGDAEALWFGTPKLQSPVLQNSYFTSGASKYVFMHYGDTNYLLDTVYVGLVSNTYSGNALEAQQFSNNPNGGYGSGLLAVGGNISATLSDEEWGTIARVLNNGAGGITNARAFNAQNGTTNGGGTIANYYGFSSNDLSVGTNNFGFHSLVNAGSGKWAFYGAGTAPSKLGGDLTIDTLAGSGNAFACLDDNGKIYRSATACVP